MKTQSQIKNERRQALADFGEDRAFRLLKHRFDVIEKMPPNFPFFDLMARQGTRTFLIPVKTRTKFKPNGDLRTADYNLYWKEDHFPSVSKIANFFGAKIVWVAVTVDPATKTFCAYMGDVTSNPPLPRYIPMHPTRHVPDHDCLASNWPDEAISLSWRKITETVSANEDQP
jgi:hypothetical protein